ncbi:hypothetical protein Pmani_008387 [Petrolisthes manimaculis]|uniref:Uncharacterized protein n=1 Tax=Petrolisthes manimaculis TaxID=1843537 RepID=A0AAE1Q6E8_9EUCA|nr:hypothetical protein Pmani_008387 [Petrolisthes manimaculis]
MHVHRYHRHATSGRVGISGSLAPDTHVSFVGKASLVDTTLKYTSRTSTLTPYKCHFTVGCVENKPPAGTVSGNTSSSTTPDTPHPPPHPQKTISHNHQTYPLPIHTSSPDTHNNPTPPPTQTILLPTTSKDSQSLNTSNIMTRSTTTTTTTRPQSPSFSPSGPHQHSLLSSPPTLLPMKRVPVGG